MSPAEIKTWLFAAYLVVFALVAGPSLVRALVRTGKQQDPSPPTAKHGTSQE